MFRQEEVFRILRDEWRPNEIPSDRFKEAMNELLKRVEEEKIITPREAFFDSLSNFERNIMELLNQTRENLRSTVES